MGLRGQIAVTEISPTGHRRNHPVQPDPANPPGDIDPVRAVLIADLGNGWDQPIALDYRTSTPGPRVLLFCWRRNGRGNRWVEIAPNIESFSDLIGL